MNGRRIVVLVFLCLANAFTWSIVYDFNQPQFFKVVFFDVGQGDSILIETHLGHYVLIDGGEDSVVLDKLAQRIPFYRKEIDLVVLTHAHSDHLGGLTYVLDNYQVNNVLWNGAIQENSLSLKWLEQLNQKNRSVKIAQSGQRIKAGDFFIDILYPFQSVENETFSDLNSSSIVLRVVYKDKSFLLTGDADKKIEQELVEMEKFCEEQQQEIKCRVMVLDSDVLKVGHHGSKTSTDKSFIERVSPTIAVISVGQNNRHNHPHQEVLEVLDNYGIRIERTDLKNDIEIVIN
jgi:competence protein ComEC